MLYYFFLISGCIYTPIMIDAIHSVLIIIVIKINIAVLIIAMMVESIFLS